jgi:hypothetical protein
VSDAPAKSDETRFSREISSGRKILRRPTLYFRRFFRLAMIDLFPLAALL